MYLRKSHLESRGLSVPVNNLINVIIILNSTRPPDFFPVSLRVPLLHAGFSLFLFYDTHAHAYYIYVYSIDI